MLTLNFIMAHSYLYRNYFGYNCSAYCILHHLAYQMISNINYLSLHFYLNFCPYYWLDVDVECMHLAGAFLIPYALMILLLGIPLLFMEYGFGQYFGIGSLSIFKQVCPLFQGALNVYCASLLNCECILNNILNLTFSLTRGLFGIILFYIFAGLCICRISTICCLLKLWSFQILYQIIRDLQFCDIILAVKAF